MNLPLIASAVGLILSFFGIILLTPMAVALIEQDYFSLLPFGLAGCSAVACGLLLQYYGRAARRFEQLRKKEGLFIVTLTWVLVALFGALPYLFYGLHPLDAYFESVSGVTTTGATILRDFSAYPGSFFFWRSLSQWLGGMGIIVLFVAILPQFAVAGRQIFFAEAPGPTEEKITPRITHTAKALWLVYVALTLVEIACLILAGMAPFDAVCNGLATMAAGGFSPHPLSIMGYENSTVVWIITLFMFLAGSNFALQYQLMVKLKGRALWSSGEFRLYLKIILGLSAVLALMLWQGNSRLVAGIRDSLFQIISLVTTTGFSSADFALWAVPAKVILFSTMLIGGCAGSAGGGIKVVRIGFLFRFLKREIVQIIHPKAILPLRIEGRAVNEETQRQMLGFLLCYLALMIISALLVTIIEQDAQVGLVGTAATIGNIGPGFGAIGPMGSFADLAWLTKLIFIANMIGGRLELIPLLVLLHPDFWQWENGVRRQAGENNSFWKE
ncbi:TrkH family potassium uptake protein [Desulfogranum mediterraneum]|uniref:TrkH family potassium uptake protein n=1 Tax=Desulfogranum mediterraneum TaxID=160661 RepID=UPI0004037CA4|nr:TrkH family potassium uptake protein [Desulfogranum mediterraneum]